MKCELRWKGKKCNNESCCRIDVTIHSNVYARAFEVGNRIESYLCCQEHWQQIKGDRNVTRREVVAAV